MKQVQVKSSKLQVKMHVFKIITLTTGSNWDQVLSEQKALVLSYVLLLLPDFYRSNPHILSYLNDCLFSRPDKIMEPRVPAISDRTFVTACEIVTFC